MESNPFLNGKEKTPIVVATNLQTANAVTRAVDEEFEKDELLNAYIKHVTVADASANPLVWSADVTGTGVGPRLANFKVSALTDGHKNDADNWRDHTTTSTLTVTDAQGLYWDDFSNSTDAAHDLRTSGHALMVYYGYGYNGGTATTALTETTGVLGWTVATDQTSGFKTSDLLYAGQQTPVAYVHGTNNTINGRDRVLTVPYTHAMSKVTIEVICDEGFEADATKNFGSAVVKLYQAGTVTEVTGPTKSVSKGTTPSDINMQKLTPTDAKHCSFSGLMAPTVLKAGETFATIEGIDGNNYSVIMTDAAIDAKATDGTTTLTNAWSTQLAEYNAASVTPDATAAYTTANGGLTKPGVHYMLTVTIKKQQIKVEATIQDWTAVSAEGVGQILFDNDVTDKTGGIADALKTNGFDLYKSTTTDFGTKATTVSWNNTEWQYSPKIYWQNKDDAEYFRALSGADADDAATTGVNESLAMAQGKDVLWGTTAAHSGTDVNGNAYHYDKSAQIDPRTGNVPLEFEHAMSKISVVLKTSSNADGVNLAGATIDIINTYNEGKIDINTGYISDLELSLTPPAIYTLSETVNSEYKLLDQIVIPQSLVTDEDNNVRNSAPTFYQSGELTLIYDNGTSLPAGGGSGTYYLTSSLGRVNYEASELTAIYADGTSIDDGSGNSTTYETATLLHVDQVLYTQVEIDAAKALVDAVTDEVRAAAAANAGDVKTPAVTHPATQDDVDNGDAEKIGDTVIDTPAVLYTQDEIDEAKAKIAAVTPEVEATARATAGTVKTPEHYKLQDGSIQANEGDFHYYKTNGSSEQHNPGELKSPGNKIMLYVTLDDGTGTRYSIELSKCKDTTSDDYVEEWERGEHYTYEITLGKEEIIFRALVKDWVEKTGSGDATLDWD